MNLETDRPHFSSPIPKTIIVRSSDQKEWVTFNDSGEVLNLSTANLIEFLNNNYKDEEFLNIDRKIFKDPIFSMTMFLVILLGILFCMMVFR